MNKKGAWVASLTVVFLFVYLFSSSMLMKRSIGDVKIEDTGKIFGIAINLTLEEEETKFFLEKAFEYSAFNALKELGIDGGTLKENNCERINEHVIWQKDCFFSDKFEQNFFSRFNENFFSYINKIGHEINTESDHDEKGKFFLKTNGMIKLENENVKYGFEPNINFYPEYDFGEYARVLRMANECLKKEKEKGPARNNLFEECRDDKDFKWEIKIEDKFALFDVSKPYKNLGEITIRFSLPE
ncbi:hypothetical protein HYT56_00755 [Candidatus Woesearchaeota archaeon]|nr:hypothetical protein [Candidatus Woesearchaeota archaeon]